MAATAATPGRAALLALLVLGGVSGRGAGAPDDAPGPCPAAGAAVAVSTRKHELYLCREGVAQGRFQVALGRGGFDKRRRGDGRTPVGTYALGPPARSRKFRTFIPLAYPSPEQRAHGYTGGGLGIHGPPRAWNDPVAARVLDWTDGCIATGTDEEVERIAAFVREHRPVAVIQ